MEALEEKEALLGVEPPETQSASHHLSCLLSSLSSLRASIALLADSPIPLHELCGGEEGEKQNSLPPVYLKSLCSKLLALSASNSDHVTPGSGPSNEASASARGVLAACGGVDDATVLDERVQLLQEQLLSLRTSPPASKRSTRKKKGKKNGSARQSSLKPPQVYLGRGLTQVRVWCSQ